RGEPQDSTGGLTDSNTGWSYHGARWMNPQEVRWTAPDPMAKAPAPVSIESLTTMNPYVYGDQNPLIYGDPDGLAPAPVWVDVDTTTLRQLAAQRGIGNGGTTLKESQKVGLAFQHMAIRMEPDVKGNNRTLYSGVRDYMTGG